MNEAIIIQMPTRIPTMPSLPCFGAILSRNAVVLAFATSLFERNSLLIKPEPSMKPNAVDIVLPARMVTHQLGTLVN